MTKKLSFILEVEGGKKLVSTLANTKLELSGVTKELNKTKKELEIFKKGNKAQIKVLTDQGKSLESVTGKFAALTAKQIDLKEQQRRVNGDIRDQVKLFDDVGKRVPNKSLIGLRREYRKLRKEIDLMDDEMLNSEKSMKKVARANNIKKQIDARGAAVEDFRSQVGRYKLSVIEALRSVGREGGLRTLFNTGIGSVGAAGLGGSIKTMLGFTSALFILRRGIGDTVNTTREFEQEQAVLNSILGQSEEVLRTLTQAALGYGATTAFTAKQVTELQTELAKLGFKPDEILDATKGIIDFSIATRAEVPEAAALAGAALRSFELDADQMGRVVSVLGVSTTKSALTFKKLENALPKVAVVASLAGDSIETMTSRMGVLADRGLESSVIGTSLRNIYIRLGKAGLTWAEGMDQIRSSTDKTNTAVKLFGVRAATAAVILAENEDAALELEGALNGVTNELQIMAEKQLNTVAGKMKLLTSAWQGFILSFDSGGGVFSNTINAITTGTTDLLNYFTELNNIDAATQIRQDRDELEDLLTVLANNKDNLSVRTRVINELNSKYPSYLQNINLEKIALEDVVEVIKDYNTFNATRLDTAIKESKRAELLERQKELIEDIVEQERQAEYNSKNFFSGSESAARASSRVYQAELKEVEEALADLNKQLAEPIKAQRGGAVDFTRVKSLNKETTKYVATLAELRTEQGELRSYIVAAKLAGDDYNDTLEDYQRITAKINAITSVFSTSQKAAKDADNVLKVALTNLTDVNTATRAIAIQNANETIQDEKVRLATIKKITLDSTIALLNAKLKITKIAGDKAILENALFGAESDLANVEIELKLVTKGQLIEDIKNELISIAQLTITDAEELERRIQEIRTESNIATLKNQLTDTRLTSDERYNIEKALQEKVAALALSNAKKDIDYEARSEEISDDTLKRLYGIIPNLDEITTNDLEKLKEYNRQKRIIIEEDKLSQLVLDKEALIAASESINEINVQIAEQELALNALVNAEKIKQTTATLKKEEQLRKQALKAQEKLISDVGVALGKFVSDIATSQEDAGKKLLKSMSSIILDLIGQQLTLMAVRAYGSADSVASLGIAGTAKLVLLTGLIKGAVNSLKSTIKFEEGGRLPDTGGVFKGPSHKNGGINVNAQGGEAFIKKEATSKWAGLLSAINVDSGGRSFSNNDVQWLNILRGLGGQTMAEGGLIGSDINIPQLANGSNLVVSARISKADMQELAQYIKEGNEESLTPIVEKVVSNMIIGLDETNRLKERFKTAENAGLI